MRSPVPLLVVLALLLPLARAEEPQEDAASRFFRLYDRDGDGRLSRDEWPAFLDPFFREVDANGDGFVDRAEDAACRRRSAARPRPAREEPTHANLAYGPHERNVLDLWLAPSESPTPLVVYFHGGGFRAGDKRSLDRELRRRLLEEGISVAASNYRLTDVAPFPAPMRDAGRALQWLRHHAAEYRLDPGHVGVTGGSAGAGISLWLAFHDDLASPEAEDPVARESTRVQAAVAYAGQSTYDPRVIAELFETDEIHPALVPFYGMSGPEDVKDPRFFPLFEEASPVTHLTPDDPPVYLYYPQANQPLPPGSSGGRHIHHPLFGFYLLERARKAGVECVVRLREDVGGRAPVEEYVAFFVKHLRAD